MFSFVCRLDLAVLSIFVHQKICLLWSPVPDGVAMLLHSLSVKSRKGWAVTQCRLLPHMSHVSLVHQTTGTKWQCLWPCLHNFQTLTSNTPKHETLRWVYFLSPQQGAADTEIKVPSVGNKKLKGSPFKAWGRSVYSHIYYTYCQGFLPC